MLKLVDAGPAKPGPLVIAPAQAPTTPGGDPARVKEIFRTHCLFQCHGGGKEPQGGRGDINRDLLIKKEKVVPGKNCRTTRCSFLLVTAEDDTVMPPQGPAPAQHR